MKDDDIAIMIIFSLFIGFLLGTTVLLKKQETKSADINKDGIVNELDLSIVMSQWTK